MDGKTAMTMPAIAYCHCVFICPTNVYAASTSVFVLLFELTISRGSRKSFQIHMTSSTMTVTVTDFRSGKITILYVCQVVAPSTVAASSRSLGIVAMKL